jgi:hypothetical protein
MIQNDDLTSEKGKIKPKKAFSEQLTFWIGIIGSLITILLTVWNTHTKSQIDQREEELKALEIQLKERATGVEESKERVDRYKWVLSLFPVLSGKNENERNFTLKIARLALTKDEAEQLFTGLQASSDTALRSIGQNGIAAIQNEPIAILVSQMNASTANERKNAADILQREHASSSQAITLALRSYDQENIGKLNPNGMINGLYYLTKTDPAVWDKQQLMKAKQMVSRVESTKPGSRTAAALNDFKSHLRKVEANLQQ